MYDILNKIDNTKDLKKLIIKEKEELAQEIRDFIIENVAKTGGHLASSLGVVELTIALHDIFNTPEDKIVWDVGHQVYAHKILTGRKEKFATLRQFNGIAGFPKRQNLNTTALIQGIAVRQFLQLWEWQEQGISRMKIIK